jgi:hypothetical protein
MEPFHVRRQAFLDRAAAAKPRAFTVAELFAQEFPLSSEDRLEEISTDTWSPDLFRDAARELLSLGGLKVRLCDQREQMPARTLTTSFKYNDYDNCLDRIAQGERLLVAVVLEGKELIAYGFAIWRQPVPDIDIIDVDLYSRRSVGLSNRVFINHQEFSVGVGHIVVDALATGIHTTIKVDATTSSSRFIFKSLGFVRQPREKNPCLLWLPRKPT